MYLRSYEPLDPKVEKIVSIAVDCGVDVHTVLGPGFK